MSDTVESSQSECLLSGKLDLDRAAPNWSIVDAATREGENVQDGKLQFPEEPPFPLEDEESRRAWLWKLLYKCCQARAADSAKIDTRFVVHLSTMLELSGSSGKSKKADSVGDLATFLESMSPEAFTEYKQLG